MPRFCRFLCGPRVTVSPQVMSGARRPASTFAPATARDRRRRPPTPLPGTAPTLRSLGAMSSTFMNTGRVFCQASFRPFGGSGSLRNASSLPISRSASRQSSPSTPIARATRCGVPNRLPSTGIVRVRSAKVAFGLLEQERGPAGLQHAIAELRHFELRVDRRAYALQFAAGFELGDEIAQVVVGHHRIVAKAKIRA